MSTYTKEVRIYDDEGNVKKTLYVPGETSDLDYVKNRDKQLKQAQAYADSKCQPIRGESEESFNCRWNKIYHGKVDDLCREKGI